MRTINQVYDATPFNAHKNNLQLFRVIGSTDIDGQGIAHALPAVDPFIFLDDAKIEGELATGFSKHPHTGLTAISYLLEGTGHAWDNLHGATADLNRAGGVYCIHAGKGVVHGEAPIEGVRKLRLLQLWLNPGIYKHPLAAASYQLFQPHELPTYEDDKLWAKIIIGESFNSLSPVKIGWPVQYLHIRLKAKQNYQIPINHADWQGFVYVIHGVGQFGTNQLSGTDQQCLVFGPDAEEGLMVRNDNDVPLEFILAAGQPHHQAFFKLLGHGGAIVADTEKNARHFMHQFEMDPDNFGR